MISSRTTLLAAALTAALAAGPSWAQGTGGGPGPASGVGAAGNAGTGSAASTAPARGSASGRSDLARADKAFVMDAAAAGMAEVQAGQLAAQKAQSPQVKQFAQRMVEDHTAANGELMKLASARNLTPPAEPDRKHRAAIDKLGKQSGADFDRAYMKMQVADHEKTVALFEKQAKNGKGDELRQWASAKLPALREHLQMARSDMNGMGDQSRHGGSGAMPGGAAGSAHSGTGSSNTAGAGNAATPGGAGMPGNAMTGRPSGPSGGNASASGAK